MNKKQARSFENIQLEIKDTLDRLGCLEVVQASSRHGDMRFLCRVHDENKWMTILNNFLLREKEESWYSFFGKKYFRKEGRLVYGWVIAFEADDLDTTSIRVRQVFSQINEALTTKKAEDELFGGGHTAVKLHWPSGSYNEKVSRRAKPMGVDSE